MFSLDLIHNLLQGILIGLFVSIPMGPIGVLCIQRTLLQGRLSGFISGFGAACADTVFASIAGLGLTLVSDVIAEYRLYIMLVGACFLFYLGLRMIFRNTIKQVRAYKYKQSNLINDFLSVFFLTITNPITIIVYGFVFASIGLAPDNLASLSTTLLGIFGGAISIWLLLALMLDIFRKHFRLRIIFYINKIAGVIIILFGIFAAYNAFVPTESNAGNYVPIINNK